MTVVGVHFFCFDHGPPGGALAAISSFVADHDFDFRVQVDEAIQAFDDSDIDRIEQEIRSGRKFPRLAAGGEWSPLLPTQRLVLTRRFSRRRAVYEQLVARVELTIQYALDGSYPAALNPGIWTTFYLVDGLIWLRGPVAAVERLELDLRKRLDPTFGVKMGQLEPNLASEWGTAIRGLSARAKNVMALARQEAARSSHQCLGTEHVLLGVLLEGGLATETLVGWGVTAEQARQEVVHVGRSSEGSSGPVVFSPLCRTVLDLSRKLAGDSGGGSADPEHLLYSLIRDDSGTAVAILGRCGVDLVNARNHMRDALRTDPG